MTHGPFRSTNYRSGKLIKPFASVSIQLVNSLDLTFSLCFMTSLKALGCIHVLRVSGPRGDPLLISPSLRIGCSRPTPSPPRLLKPLRVMIMTHGMGKTRAPILAMANICIKESEPRRFSGLNVSLAPSPPLICLFGKARRLVSQCFSVLYKNKWALSNFNYNGEYAAAPHSLVCFCCEWGSDWVYLISDCCPK